MKKINVFFLIGFLFLSIEHLNPNNYPSNNLLDNIKITVTKNVIENKLGDETNKIIKFYAPNSKLNGYYLAAKCLEYNIDISFVLAQALLESNFGTKGKAKITNSVWNVGTYDDGTILYTYNHPNQSIVPYLNLLKKRYLLEITQSGDTIPKNTNKLLEYGYTNIKGYRFASEPKYEKRLKYLINKIKYQTKIEIYQNYFNNNNKLLTYYETKIKQEL